MRTKINWDLCNRCGECQKVCPEVFWVNSQNRQILKDPIVEPNLKQKVRLAAQSCPKRAITLSSITNAKSTASYLFFLDRVLSILEKLTGDPRGKTNAALTFIAIKSLVFGGVLSVTFVGIMLILKYFGIEARNEFFGKFLLGPIMLATIYYFGSGLKYLINGVQEKAGDEPLSSVGKIICTVGTIALFIFTMLLNITLMTHIKFKYIDPAQVKAEKNETQKEFVELLNKGKKAWNSKMSGPRGYALDLKKIDLSNRDLSGYNLKQIDFEGATMVNTNFNGSVLYDTNFTGANLEGATFRGAFIYHGFNFKIGFEKANLTNADFTGAFMTKFALKKAKLKNTIVKNLKKPNKEHDLRKLTRYFEAFLDKSGS